MRNKTLPPKLMKDMSKLFYKYLDKGMSIDEIINSSDLFIDTVKKEKEKYK